MKIKTKVVLRLLFVLSLCLTATNLVAQKDAKKRGPEYYEKKDKKEKEKKAKEGEEAAKQRHLDIQSKETKKRMKRTEKKAKRHRNPRSKGSFFRRIFH